MPSRCGASCARGTSVWQYGRTEQNAAGEFVSFIPFGHWQKDRWQPEPVYPSTGTLSHVNLGRYGGHPGGKPEIATVARWTAPERITVLLEGTLKKGSSKGDGIRARLLKNGTELLKEIVCAPGQSIPTQFGPIEVAAGDTIDFRLDSMDRHDNDSYEWSPVVRSASNPRIRWDYSKDFGGPADLADAVEIYAQALISTNEFCFID
jgi:hypothetical protein